MSDNEFIRELLLQVSGLADDVAGWFEKIEKVEDFSSSSDGRMVLSAICMNLIALGEGIKNIDAKTDGKLFARYPNIPWKQVMRTRDFIAHHYFEVDEAQVWTVCHKHIPALRETLLKIVNDTQPTA